MIRFHLAQLDESSVYESSGAIYVTGKATE